MKKTKESSKKSSLIWASLVMALACVGYVFSKSLYVLILGIIGFGLLMVKG